MALPDPIRGLRFDTLRGEGLFWFDISGLPTGNNPSDGVAPGFAFRATGTTQFVEVNVLAHWQLLFGRTAQYAFLFSILNAAGVDTAPYKISGSSELDRDKIVNFFVTQPKTVVDPILLKWIKSQLAPKLGTFLTKALEPFFFGNPPGGPTVPSDPNVTYRSVDAILNGGAAGMLKVSVDPTGFVQVSAV